MQELLTTIATSPPVQSQMLTPPPPNSFWETGSNAMAVFIGLGTITVGTVVGLWKGGNFAFTMGRTASRIENKVDDIQERIQTTSEEMKRLNDRMDDLTDSQRKTEERVMRWLSDHRKETSSGFNAFQSQINDLRGMFNRLIRSLRENQILTKEQFDPRERDEV